MAAKKFLRNIAGTITEIFGIVTSAGAGNAGDIPALDDTGRLDSSLMPVGIGADTKLIECSEALTAGNWVNVWDDAGDFKVRKADATTDGKKCHGFVLVGASSGADATVYFEGTNNQVTSQTPGDVFLGTTAGAGSATAPSASGNVVQRVGVAISATEVNFEPTQQIVLA